MIPDLTISIVNHSNPSLLRDCIRSVLRNSGTLEIELVVVDNATDQQLVPEIRKEFPRVRWIFNRDRKGFSENHNQVLSSCHSRYMCILNDDTLVRPAAFERVLQFMQANHDVGMAAPRLTNPDGSLQMSVFRTVRMEYFVRALLPGLCRGVKATNPLTHDSQFSSSPTKFDGWLLGACIVVRRECVERVGLLDAQMSPIANSEDMDWCLRACNSGFRLGYVPSAEVMHYGGMTLRLKVDGIDRMRVELVRTFISYMRKHFGIGQALTLRLLYGVSTPWRIGVAAARAARGRVALPQLTSEVYTELAIAYMALAEWPLGSRR